MGSDALALQVDGQIYIGWESVQVTCGIEQLAGAFELAGTDRWAINKQANVMLTGLPCSVTIAGVPVITGFIDDAESSYDAQSHRLTLRGRDATGDLVDSAALADGQGWQNRALAEIAADLLKPFGIPVTVDATVNAAAGTATPITTRRPFKTARINPGETVFEVLSRLAASRGALLVSDQQGGLLITRAGSKLAQTGLKHGVNILSGQGLHSHRQRFHTCKVIGQMSGIGGRIVDLPFAQQVLATLTDPAIRATRTTVIVVSDNCDAALAKQVASWARANAAAKGERVTVWVHGWLDGATPWRPNTLVQVDDAYLRAQGQWLIAQVQFVLDTHNGALTSLTLTPPAAYVPNPAAALDPTQGLG